MDRIAFFNSISGIDYPYMLVNYYDQFLALKELVTGCSTINVLSSDNAGITFNIVFGEPRFKDQTLSIINKFPGRILIYGKFVPVIIDNLTDIEITLTLMK